MAEHTDEPHVHTITFTDNDGDSHSVDVPCPSSNDHDFGELLASTGADSVNDLAVDGKRMTFEGVFVRLGVAGKLPMLGASYQTPENLTKLMVSMGTYDDHEVTA